jgi:hypothetical protein
MERQLSLEKKSVTIVRGCSLAARHIREIEGPLAHGLTPRERRQLLSGIILCIVLGVAVALTGVT